MLIRQKAQFEILVRNAYNTLINLVLCEISLGGENQSYRIVETGEVVMAKNFQEQETVKLLR